MPFEYKGINFLVIKKDNINRFISVYDIYTYSETELCFFGKVTTTEFNYLEGVKARINEILKLKNALENE